MLAALTVEEVTFLLRYKNVETVRRMIKDRKLRGFGQPYRIPIGELVKYGFDQKSITAALQSRGEPHPSQP